MHTLTAKFAPIIQCTFTGFKLLYLWTLFGKQGECTNVLTESGREFGLIFEAFFVVLSNGEAVLFAASLSFFGRFPFTEDRPEREPLTRKSTNYVKFIGN